MAQTSSPLRCAMQQHTHRSRTTLAATPSLYLTHRLQSDPVLLQSTMRHQPLAGWRALGTRVLATALVVLSVVWCTHANPGNASEESENVPGVLCPRGFQLAQNNDLCVLRAEGGVNMAFVNARRKCQARGNDLAEPLITNVTACTASSPCWLGGRCHIYERVTDGEQRSAFQRIQGGLRIVAKLLTTMSDEEFEVYCEPVAPANPKLDSADLAKSDNWVYGPLTPGLVAQHGGAAVILIPHCVPASGRPHHCHVCGPQNA